jgi:hypothetical protein
MRPVNRRRLYQRLNSPKFARALLTERLGDYCSYCGRPTAAAVEHILPWENKHTRLWASWTNLLLTCIKCNNYKKSRQVWGPSGSRSRARRRYYWPDSDNTQRAFQYGPLGMVVPSPDLDADQYQIADDTIWMLGLREPDQRSLRRAEVWTEAANLRNKWVLDPSLGRLEDIVRCARLAGMWEVWRTVFSDQPQVVLALDRAFPGTDRASFDPVTGIPRRRAKGKL